MATLEAGKIQILREVSDLPSATIKSALKVHKIPAELRPYY